MDLFTHILVTYFFNVLLGNPDENAILFSIFMGISPDFDILWAPFLGKKFLYARHHGFSHSIFYILSVDVFFAFMVYFVFSVHTTPFHMLILWGLLGGGLHLLSDLITTWSVPLLYPVSKREYRYSLDVAVNPYMSVISLVSIIILFQFRGRMDYGLYKTIITALFSIYLGYFLMRLYMKNYIIHRYSEGGERVTAIPTRNPFQWIIATRSHYDNINHRWTTGKVRYAYFNFLRKDDVRFHTLDINIKDVQPPIDSIDKAIWYTFNTPEVHETLRKLRYPVFIFEEGEFEYRGKKYPYAIFWYALETEGKNTRWGVRLYVDRDGNYEARKALVRVKNR